MKKTIITACISALLMQQAYAEFGEWTRNQRSTPAPQNTPKPQETVTPSQTQQTPARTEPVTTPQQTVSAPQPTPKAPVQVEQPRPVARTPVTQTPPVTSADLSGSNINPDQLNQYLKQSMALANPGQNTKMNPKHTLALATLNGVLVGTATEIMEGGKSSIGPGEIAKAIGCINSYQNPELSARASQVLMRHSQMAGMERLLENVPKIGSSYTAKCG